MNRIRFGASALALALTLGMASGASALTLKAVHYLSPKHPIGVGYETFAEELKKNTDGEIKVRIFPAESLLAAKAISDGVRDQVADIDRKSTRLNSSH